MTPFRAFALWRALRDRPVFVEDEATIAGRRGEAGIDRVLTGDATSLWSGRRVPRPRGRGRVEIDHILLTGRALYLVETKAWTGSLRIEGEGAGGHHTIISLVVASRSSGWSRSIRSMSHCIRVR